MENPNKPETEEDGIRAEALRRLKVRLMFAAQPDPPPELPLTNAEGLSMVSRKKNPPMPQAVTVEIDGKTYRGTYTVDQGVISVSSGLGTKRTQVGGLTPENLAQMMLGELVREGKA